MIAIISLRESHARRKPLVDSLKRQNANFFIFEGFDGRSIINPSFRLLKRKHYNNKQLQKMTLGEVGCTISHIMVIKTAKTFGWESVAVLEDDARVGDDFCQRLEDITPNVPEDTDLLYIGGILWEPFKGRRVQELIYDASTSIISGAHGYIAFKNGYDAIIDKFSEFVATTDDLLNEGIVYEKRIKAYAIRPWLCYQDNVKSDINHGIVCDRSKSRY